jgi:hypothetical protein
MGDASRNPTTEEPAHDILAAEAFAMPAPDPAFRHDLVVPEDPRGTAEPHDILAAEEFAMPAPGRRLAEAADSSVGYGTRPRLTWLSAAGLVALWLRRRHR